MSAFYNEIDPYAAQWLRNLIKAGHIADGVVDERSILDLHPEELREFTQCHFFAGIGVWSHALRLAQWPDTRAVWSGSCPCQPFSVAGRSAGVLDERHLWPHWFWLIEQCRPAVIFGEQVEAAIGHGWLDLVQSDLEGIHYAVGHAGLPAGGVGAPHMRKRVWFVAHHHHQGLEGGEPQPGRQEQQAGERGGAAGGVAVTATAGRRLVGWGGRDSSGDSRAHPDQHHDALATRPADSFWRDADWLLCRDGKWRPVEPGTFPLAHGAAARVGRLRAYGNAIVPQVAAEVIAAFMECRP